MRVDTERNEAQFDKLQLMALAHELKAPLGVIRQISLARDYFSQQEKEAAFERIELLSSRSLRLIEVLSRSYNHDTIESETLNLNRLCEDVIHEFAPLTKAMDQRFEVRLPRQPIMAVGNREMMHSIIVGLCDNALSYGSEQSPIEVSLSSRLDTARLSVRDDGPALSPKNLALLKERIGKTTQPFSQRPQSSGLGLYIAGQFSQAMKGSLGVTAHRKGGQSFYVEVPRSSQLSLLGI